MQCRGEVGDDKGEGLLGPIEVLAKMKDLSEVVMWGSGTNGWV